jgi:hypothetical protein
LLESFCLERWRTCASGPNHSKNLLRAIRISKVDIHLEPDTLTPLVWQDATLWTVVLLRASDESLLGSIANVTRKDREDTTCPSVGTRHVLSVHPRFDERLDEDGPTVMEKVVTGALCRCIGLESGELRDRQITHKNLSARVRPAPNGLADEVDSGIHRICLLVPTEVGKPGLVGCDVHTAWSAPNIDALLQ